MPSLFTGDLCIKQLDDWRFWRLLESLSYDVGYLGSGQTITVKAGFVSDGASVPRPFWAILPVWGSYSRAAIIHDYLFYRIRKGNPHPLAPTFDDANRIMWEAMGVCKTGLALKCLIYFGVWLRTGFPYGEAPNDKYNVDYDG